MQCTPHYNFVLKIFDIFTLPTIQIIFILSSVYDNVYICKPNTSRIANSEKYLVCKNYKHNRNLIKYFINNPKYADLKKEK